MHNHWLELSRAALAHNLAGIRRLAGHARIIAVVKKNAYGAGAVTLAHVLAAEGIDAFAVANVREGIELREGGVRGLILCMTFFTQDEVPAIFSYALTPAVFTAEAARWLSEHGSSNGQDVGIWIKIDTGLWRLGVPAPDAPAFIDEIVQLEHLKLGGLFSTLSENPERDPVQVARLRAIRQSWPHLQQIPLSIASSHALLSLPGARLDAVRVGITLLGFDPGGREGLDSALVSQADLQPVVTWKARVGYAKVVPKGEQVGYGIRPALSDDMRVATVTVGWGDGYPFALSNVGEVLVHGVRCPVLAVSANSIMVDASRVPGVAIGDEAGLSWPAR